MRINWWESGGRQLPASKADVWTVWGGEEEEEKVEGKIYEENQHRERGNEWIGHSKYRVIWWWQT